MNRGQEIGRVDRMLHGKTSGRHHAFTAAFAAIADEIDFAADIFTELNQAFGAGGGENIQCLPGFYGAGVAVADKGFRRKIQRQTDILGGIADIVSQCHFMPAVTPADPDSPG